MIHFPLYSQGLAWLVPALCTFSVLHTIRENHFPNNKNADNDLSAFFYIKVRLVFARFRRQDVVSQFQINIPPLQRKR